MSANAPSSQVEFAQALAEIRSAFDARQSPPEQLAERLKKLLDQTGCQAALERMVGVKVHLQVHGPHAGRFLTDPFPTTATDEGDAPSPIHVCLTFGGWGIESEEVGPGSMPAGQKTEFCFSVDPTQPDFFQCLENYVVGKKIEARGLADERSAVYREFRRQAEDEAQLEIWRHLPRGICR